MKQLEQIRTIGIAGAGLMGASMAQIFAMRGYPVILYDNSPEGLERGKQLIKDSQEKYIQMGKLDEKSSQEIVGRIFLTMEKKDFVVIDFLVECIFEKMEVKHQFWGEVSDIVSTDAVLTTNTSGLSITEIAKAVKGPERFAGMHWVNPPHLVPLVEVIAGDETASETLDVVKEVALAIHRKPIMVEKDVNGFVLNRLQYALLREAFYIVESGIASMEDVDNVMKYGLGMRYAAIGPFETVDLGGVDTFYNVSSYLLGSLCNSTQVPKLLEERYKAGAYGTKTRRGLYDYPGDAALEKVRKRDEDFMKLAECLFGEETKRTEEIEKAGGS